MRISRHSHQRALLTKRLKHEITRKNSTITITVRAAGDQKPTETEAFRTERSEEERRSRDMGDYPPESQLVCEWYTPSLSRTLDFLKPFGFIVLREEEAHFAELAWGSSKSRLMVEQMEGFAVLDEDESSKFKFGWRGYVGNIRVMVPDVDSVYQVALQIEGATILKGLENRYYGLRDFTVGGPFGIALRFATPLPGFDES